MTEREKNGERLAMKISRHRQAKHEAIQYEDVKTAYIKGCEDTAKENSGNLDGWHDLRKNPQDLPDFLDEENKIITVKTRRRYERKLTEHRVIEVVGYFDNKQRHNTYFNLGTREFDLTPCYGEVIAWHKLPATPGDL